ncbi:integration host factor subunit beta [Verrucomicrobiales bacterium]|nr:integration host factor subunit beta [Verrucomicrobiales bacterium]MDA9922415.1 integration host factor subunit beta [Verrucomicrobiales bacterium]MDB3941519.1 integration host factor subunit beta [Verrucomicrobiales bacterium]
MKANFGCFFKNFVKVQYLHWLNKNMATITKRDLVIQISNQTGLTQQEVFSVLQSFIEEVTGNLATNNDVVLRNFGAFQVTKTKPKIGRNPNNPEKAVPIPARAVVKFKPGKMMKERVAKVLPELER